VRKFFTDARARHLDGIGHFTSVEAPHAFAAGGPVPVHLRR
jgi:hypothetical protein